jgi:purine-binding chemotaxis protein CheW
MVEPSASVSKTKDEVLDKTRTSQFVAFQVDSQRYAFPIEQIQEIVILEQVTRTPQTADCIEGVSNLRGTIIPIVNLRTLMGLEPKPAVDQTRTIIVNVGQRMIGCTVDAVTQVIRIADQAVQPAPPTLVVAGDYLSGFAKMDDGLVILLDVDQLLDPIRFQADAN